jgi:hypothetical protein
MYQFTDLSIPYNQPYVDNLWDEMEKFTTEEKYKYLLKLKRIHAAKRWWCVERPGILDMLLLDIIREQAHKL